MGNDILFTIIVPIHNSEKYLRRCIESILNQSYVFFELLLIDDGSNDSSPEICDFYKSIDSRIRVFHKSNQGVSEARNIGIQLSNGDYIGFVDSDDTLEKDCLIILYQLLCKEKFDCVSYGMNKVFIDEDRIIKTVHDTSNQIFMRSAQEIKKGIIKLFPNMLIASVCNKVYSKDLIKNKSFLELTTGEDFLFNINLLTEISNYAVLENCLYNYYRDVNIKTRSNNYSFQYILDIEMTYKAVLSLFEQWDIVDRHYYKTTSNIMYGMFHNVLLSLEPEDYKRAIHRKYVRKSIVTSKSFSWKEFIYKYLLLLKGV